MRLLKSLFVLAVLFPTLALGQTQTINPVPADASSALQVFLKNEDAQRFARQFAGFVTSGGTVATVGSLTQNVTAVEGFPSGYYVSQGQTSHTFTANKTTYVLLHKDQTDPSTFSVTGGTGCMFNGRATNLIFVECASGSDRPDALVDTLWLAAVTTDGSAITTVVDHRDRVWTEKETITAGFITDYRTKWQFTGRGTLILNFGVNVDHYGTIEAPLQRIITLGGASIVRFHNRGAVVKPQWWGAIADGLRNNTAEFDQAINSIEVDGGTLFIPAADASYKMDEVIVQGSNISIEGEGYRSHLQNNAINHSIFDFCGPVCGTNYKNIQVRKLRFSQVITHTNDDNPALAFRGVFSVRVEDCDFTDVSHAVVIAYLGAGAPAKYARDGIITNNRIYNADRMGIEINGCDRCIVANNVINAALMGLNQGLNHGIRWNNNHEGQVFGNLINGFNNGISIQANPDVARDNDYAIIGPNLIKDPRSNGIQMLNDQKHMTLQGNVITGVGHPGGFTANGISAAFGGTPPALYSFSDLVIKNNEIYCNEFTKFGINVASGTDLTIKGNEMIGCGNGAAGEVWDIQVITVGGISFIQNNSISSNGANGKGIRHSSSSTGSVTIATGNVIRANGSSKATHLTLLGAGTLVTTNPVGDELNTYSDTAGTSTAWRTFTSGPTPSVGGHKRFIVNSSGPTTVTNLVDGLDGQDVVILCSTGNWDIIDGVNFRLNGSFTCTADDILHLVLRNGAWYELSRSVN